MQKIGIIGCGKIAQTRHIPEYESHPEAKLAAFYDINRQRAAELAQKYGGTAYSSVEDLLGDRSIDAVSVCTANHVHAQISMEALKAGKHVLCEKPRATTLRDGENMVREAQMARRFLMIDHNQRLAEAHAKAKMLLDDGAIGRIISVRTTFGHAGPEKWSVDSDTNIWFFDRQKAAFGVMADLGIHKTDLIQYLCSSHIKSVTARLFTLDKRMADGSLINVDDNAVCIYEMENGIVATMTASWTYYGREDNSTVLYGTDGIMRIYDDALHSVVIDRKNGERDIYDTEVIQTNDHQTKSGVIDAWMDCLIHNTEPEISGKEALYAMRAVFAAIESNDTGRTVFLQ